MPELSPRCPHSRHSSGAQLQCREDLAGKHRVAASAEFDDDDGIIAMMVQLDAERVAVAH
jgi:hypothetical protein